jgi:ornithine cyclodeaminase/alanine dehydrogenase-like protein (mu-crystallin family)
MSPVFLTRDDVASLLSLDDCIEAVEGAFRMYGEGRTAAPGVLGMPVEGGGFHVKAGVLELSRLYFAAKLNANFPGNRDRFGLPTIQGVIALCDATNGSLLALMDSIEITTLRTGAATAVAARHLARADAAVMTVCGSGSQGRVSVRAVSRVRPIRSVFVWDIEESRAVQLAGALAQAGTRVEAVTDWHAAARRSDIVVTCTPSTTPFVYEGDVRPGTFVAAVGADNPEKHEIAPGLLASAVVVTDVTAQCAAIGDLHHAIASGHMSAGGVHAELGAVVAGRAVGREHDRQVIIFDSTGTALQDVAAAAVVYERAMAGGTGVALRLY